MAFDASDAFDLMVEGVEQTSAYRLTMSIPGGSSTEDFSLTVSDIDIPSALTADLPGQSRLLSGQASITATFTLSGIFRPSMSVNPYDESMTIAQFFGPYQTSSPMYGQDMFRRPVSIDLGLYPDGAAGTPELIRRFTGFVDTYTVNTDGSVEFSCIDNRSSLRNIPQIPPLVTTAPYNSGLTSEYAVDAILRAATATTISSWPSPRSGAVFAAGFRSSPWPEIGSIDTFYVGAYTSPFTYTAGRYGSALAGLPGFYLTTASIGRYCWIEGWVTPPANGSQASIVVGASPFTITLAATTTGASLSVRNASTPSTYSVTTPIGAGTYLAGWVNWPSGGTTWSGRLYINGTQYTISTTTVPGAARSGNLSGRVNVRPTELSISDPGGIEAVQVTDGESAPFSNYSFVPGAKIDQSQNAQVVVPAVEGDAFQAIQTIAKAELAAAGFDESGVFRFRSRAALAGSPTVRTITSKTSLKALKIDQSAASVVNRAQIGYTNWRTASVASSVYSLASPKVVRKNSTTTMVLNLDNYVVQVDPSVENLPDGTYTGAGGGSYYRASVDQAGTSEHPGLSFTLTQTAANKVALVIVNQTNRDAWLVSPSNYTDVTVGTPMLNLAGFVVTPDAEVLADYQFPPVVNGGAANSRFGEVPFQLTGNPWIQDSDFANDLAADIVSSSFQPIPNLVGVQIIPDPRLQLGDRVRIVETDLTGLDEYAVIFGISISYTDGEYSMTIDARTVARPGGWILGVAGRSELGVTTRI